MRLLTTSVHSLAALVSVVILQACAPPEGMPEQAAEAAMDARVAAEVAMELTPPPGAKWLECAAGRAQRSPKTPIGPEGGEIRVGEHVLVVPQGALDTETKIQVIDVGSRNGRVIVVANKDVAFPDKLKADLTISFKDCTVPSANSKLELFRYDLDSGPSEVEDFVDDFSKSVTGQLDHLSTYVIGAM